MCGNLDAYEGLIVMSYECVGLCTLRVQLHTLPEVRPRYDGHSGESFNAATATDVSTGLSGHSMSGGSRGYWRKGCERL